jgi:effector-binding domain-containing protein
MSDGADIEIATVESVPTAVRDTRVTIAELGAAIGKHLDEVWTYIRAEGDLSPRHSIVLYKGNPSAGPADVEIGVEVDRTFDGPSETGVRCSALPAGRAARAVHRGPYDQMAKTYDALMAWADKGGHAFTGPSWEVYGDWHEDPAKLETEIYFLLGPA